MESDAEQTPIAVNRMAAVRAEILSRLHGLGEEEGMSTVEYAIGTIAAAAFAAILYTVVTGNSVVGAMTSLIERALTTPV